MAIPRSSAGVGVILIGFTTMLAMILIALFATNRAPEKQTPAEEAGSSVGLGHVHGLGIDPSDRTLYAATHYGVFRIADGEPERVADRWQDTMGFAVVGPEHFLASGHPDLREDLPAHLGLIESRDAAKTWQAVSLQGEADFHAIEPVGERIYAYDATKGALVMSDDRHTWQTLDTRPLVDLAADPAVPEIVYATTPKGELIRYEAEAGTASTLRSPPLMMIDWDRRGLVGVTANGAVFLRSTNGRWLELSAVSGRVQALDADDDGWHIATDEGIVVSADGGETWEFVVTASGHQGH